MKAVGLVVEYNPFHNGHRYHLAQAKRLTGADVVVAVMSGNFTQRGEPTILDKWSRTLAATGLRPPGTLAFNCSQSSALITITPTNS